MRYLCGCETYDNECKCSYCQLNINTYCPTLEGALNDNDLDDAAYTQFKEIHLTLNHPYNDMTEEEVESL